MSMINKEISDSRRKPSTKTISNRENGSDG